MPPPEDVKVILPPTQMVPAEVRPAVAARLALTDTLAVAVALQLLLLVAVTVKLYPPLLLLLHDTGLPTLLTKLPPLLAQV